MVKPRGQHHQQIIEQQRFKFQVELNCLVIQLHVGHLGMSKDVCSEQKLNDTGIQVKDITSDIPAQLSHSSCIQQEVYFLSL